MKFFTIMLSVLLFNVLIVYAQVSEKPETDIPSIESMLTPLEPDQSVIANDTVLKEIMGFPFKLESESIEVETALRGVWFSDLTSLRMNILKFYQEGHLSNDKRSDFLFKIIDDNYKKVKKLSHKEKLNLAGLKTKEQDINATELLSAFMVAAKFGDIQEIVPFLAFTNVHIGDFKAAFGYQGYIVSIAHGEMSHRYEFTPEQRLHFWPAANAILKNPEKTIPLLQEVVLNEKLQEYLRLRAASFLNTFDASYLSDEIVKQCNPEFQVKIECLKQKNIKWRHPIDNICSNDSRRFQMRDEITRKKLNLPENTDVSHINEAREHRIWGKY